jgi:two-component system, LytTR family, response regulator
MLSAILIDDETHNIVNLQMLLKKYCPQVQVIATAESVKEGLNIIQSHVFDVLF